MLSSGSECKKAVRCITEKMPVLGELHSGVSYSAADLSSWFVDEQYI